MAKTRPALTGTEKQVAWANTLREKFIAEVEKIYGGDEYAQKYIEWIAENKTAAAWWIERRGMPVLSVIREKAQKNKRVRHEKGGK